MFDFKYGSTGRGFHENEEPDKILDIAEKIVKCDKKQKGTGIKILTQNQIA